MNSGPTVKMGRWPASCGGKTTSEVLYRLIWTATWPFTGATPSSGHPTLAACLKPPWDALTIPTSFPAFSAIEVDRLGNLWVREYNLPGEEDRALWTVFDPEGVALGFVETPLELVIYEIGADYILGKTMDELGVEYVQLWGLDRSG